ncbi:MAG: hydroxyectoine utilization dehydratase EutB [Chloroflexi bacterium B3_Chlor]|nr:MAG: hydroxyectoine utilization dehydratase EutB [Chloroflexi bacterium B3_Chlor]
MFERDVTERDVRLARQRIAPLATRTPLISSRALSKVTGAAVYLKLENLQETGSFKVRGAANRMLTLTPEQQERGVITVSTGNHGRAVSYVAQRLDIEATICIPEGVPSNKVEAIEGLGAEIMVCGATYDEAEDQAFRLEKERGLTMVNPFDDPFVIAGQGTIGMEIVEDLPEVDTILVPVGGGGLISGIGLALKAANADARLIGVSMDRAPVMYHSLRAGSPIRMPEEDTIADALVGGIGVDNQYTFRLAQNLVDDFVLVSDEEIAAAMVFALKGHHLVVEGGGAVGIAALLHGQVKEVGRNIVVVVSGGNVDTPVLLEIVQSREHPAARG